MVRDWGKGHAWGDGTVSGYREFIKVKKKPIAFRIILRDVSRSSKDVTGSRK